MKIFPCGVAILVQPLKLEDVDSVYKKIKAAGLAVPDLSEKKREQAAIDVGVVVAIGALAWKDWGDGSPWAKVGDVIMHARHAGRVVMNEEERMLLINDEDVLCTIEGV